MRDVLGDVFDTLLAGEPPLGLSATEVARQGRRRVYRRHGLIAGGAAAAAGLTATAVGVWALAPAPVAPQPGLTATGSTAPPPSDVPPPPPPSSRPVLVVERPHCDGERIGTMKLDWTDGSVLPGPDAAVAAVLRAAGSAAPGRSFTVVFAGRVDDTAKFGGLPVMNLVFDVADAAGTGALSMQLRPQVGASPAERAAWALRERPFSNCTPATRTDYPDGSVGLSYIAFGSGSPVDTEQVNFFYAARGFDINATVFMVPWSVPFASAPGRADSMPLSAAEVLALCRAVGAA
jgi:hypothetical protein